MRPSFPRTLLSSLSGSILWANAQPSFEKDLQPYLDQHCLRCHGEKKQKGDFRLDELSTKVREQDTPLWAEVMERISSGEMPPEEVDELPSADENARVVAWIAERLRERESARMAQRSRVSYHRLTREEYVNAVRDLIGVEYDATDPGGLLEDPEWHGFERIGSVLTLSPSHIEKYIKAAEVVLDEAYPDKPSKYLELTKRADEIAEHHKHYERLKAANLLDKIRVPLTTSGEIFRRSSPFRNPENPFPGPGMYEISYTVSGITPEGGKPPRMQVYEHKLDRILFEQDILAPEEAPITVTFRTHFPDIPTPSIHVLMVLALRTDMTRVITCMICSESNGGAIPDIGISQTRHGLSHHNGDPEQLRRLTQTDTFLIEQLSYFLDQLKAHQDEDGPLLDSTQVLWGSGMAYGHSHGNANLPTIYAGGKGLGVKHGQHVDFNLPTIGNYNVADANAHYKICGRPVDSKARLSNLLLTMLQRADVESESFQDSLNVISEVVA